MDSVKNKLQEMGVFEQITMFLNIRHLICINIKLDITGRDGD